MAEQLRAIMALQDSLSLVMTSNIRQIAVNSIYNHRGYSVPFALMLELKCMEMEIPLPLHCSPAPTATGSCFLQAQARASCSRLQPGAEWNGPHSLHSFWTLAFGLISPHV